MNLEHKTKIFEVSKLAAFQLERDCYLVEFRNPSLKNALVLEMSGQAIDLKT